MINMINFTTLLTKLTSDEISIDTIFTFKNDFNDFALKVISGKVSADNQQLDAFIRLCNDVYTYSSEGEVLISDSLYDQCMNVYKSNGNDTIVYADTIGQKKWNFIKHEIPGVVGTLEKAYTYKDIKDYLRKYIGVDKFILAPKFDGISCAIKVDKGQIISAATRYNGVIGQDITELIKRAKNSENFIFPELGNGFYKCELCVGIDEFNELVKYKKYANRRSATAGIINTPTNINYASYITIIPLVFYSHKRNKMEYLAPFQKQVQYYSPADLMEEVKKMLERIRSKDFQFRVDGVVINPDRAKLGNPNEYDLMDNSIAFKVNTAEGKTKIIQGYMSVGRLGKAVPMLKVAPVEVNETIVEDVSLGSYEKFLSMDLHENEEVIVYSAGDVIPQIKLPLVRTAIYDSPLLKIKKICPYCNEKLTRENAEYFCTNEKCPRIITGKISNFLIKMGMEGFSDKSVEMIYNSLGISTISDFLNLTVNNILEVDGFDTISAENLYNEILRIKETPVSVAKFFGALGINKISEKKCRKIFEYVNLDELMNAGHKKLDKIFWELQVSDGIGAKTAKTFISFIEENRDELRDILHYIHLTGDIKYKHNVVFTGFRPTKEIEKAFNELGVEISNSVSKSTIAVISASTERDSVKSKAAISKGIPIIHANQMYDLINELKETQI